MGSNNHAIRIEQIDCAYSTNKRWIKFLQAGLELEQTVILAQLI